MVVEFLVPCVSMTNTRTVPKAIVTTLRIGNSLPRSRHPLSSCPRLVEGVFLTWEVPWPPNPDTHPKIVYHTSKTILLVEFDRKGFASRTLNSRSQNESYTRVLCDHPLHSILSPPWVISPTTTRSYDVTRWPRARVISLTCLVRGQDGVGLSLLRPKQ